MTTEALGKISFLDTPDVNGANVLTTATGVTAGNVAGTVNQVSVTGTTNPVVALAINPVLPGTEGFVPPTGTTAQRPSVPTTGEARFNTTLGVPEVYTGAAWVPTAGVLQVVTVNIPQLNAAAAVYLPAITAPTTANTSAIATAVITPISSTSRLVVVATGTWGTSAARTLTGIVTANAVLAAGASAVLAANEVQPFSLTATYSPGSVAAQTIIVRVAQSVTGATTWVNRGLTTYGDALTSKLVILEVL